MAATEVEKVCKATKQIRMKLDGLQGRKSGEREAGKEKGIDEKREEKDKKK